MKYLFALVLVCALALAAYTLLPADVDTGAPAGSTEPSGTGGGSTLDLSGQGLTEVPAYVFDRLDIVELDLSDNSLSGALQAEVRHLQNLKVLDLSGNNFTGVPAEVGQLSDLEVLDLSNNQLTGLPNEIGNLAKLRVLDVSGNAYSEADLAAIKSRLPATTEIRTR